MNGENEVLFERHNDVRSRDWMYGPKYNNGRMALIPDVRYRV
jgi:hypothetical protein